VKFWTNFLVSLKRIGLIVWLIYTSSAWLEQLLTKKMELELASTEGTSNIVWFYAGASATLSLILPIFTFIFVIASLNPRPLLDYLSSNLAQVVIENMRAAGKTLLWSLLFIIPGLIRFLQYAFVSIIVMIDPDYNLGKKDALKESTRIFNKSFIIVTFVILTFSILVPLVETQWDEYQSFNNHPLSALASTGLDSILSIIFVLLLLKIWEKKHGTHVQLETN
jgi:hypothetical protein